jgi:superfamily II DNA or RNA helicase
MLDTSIARTTLQLRPYQQRIVDRAVELFANQGLRSILIDSPTGSGKTIMALLIARAMQEKLGLRIGWVAMRRYLLAQAKAENERHGIGAEMEYISMFDRDPPTDLDMLVVDEAQHDAAQSMAVLHELVQPRFILGLSATPFRADRVKLCFDTMIKDAGIQALIQDGYLSPYHHYTLPRYDPETLASFYLRDRARWGKSLVSFHTLDECAVAERELREAGVTVEVVSGASDREAQLEAFSEGRIDVLCNCLMLSEGFDCPALKTVFCRPSCKSVTVQLAGRVLRQHPDLPYKQIVQCPRTRWPFSRTAAPAVQYAWTAGEWRSLEVNPLISQITVRTLQALARTNVTLPSYVVERSGWMRLRELRERREEE